MKNFRLDKESIINSLPFVLLGFGMLIYHMLAPIPVGDDIYFLNKPDGIFDWDFFIMRYQEWSSRIVLEFFLVVLLHLPTIVWRIVNPIIIVLLGLFVSRLVNRENQNLFNWFIVFSLLIYPFREMFAGGWITISLNYIWPLTFGLYSLLVLKQILEQKKIRLFEYVLAVLLTVFVINHEIMALFLTMIFFAASVFLMVRKRHNWFVAGLFLLCFANLLFIIFSPGNAIRQATETQMFVDFNYLSIIEKIEIGLSSTLEFYFSRFIFLFFFLCLLIFIVMSKQHKDITLRALALVPIVTICVFGNFLQSILGHVFPHLLSLDPEVGKYGLITLGNYASIENYISFILLYFSAVVVFVLIFFVFRDFRDRVYAAGILLLGFISRMAISFSPTIFASGVRTHFILLISIVICLIMLLMELEKMGFHELTEKLLILFGFTAGLSYLNALIAIL